MMAVILLGLLQDSAWEEVELQATVRADGAIDVRQRMTWAGPAGPVLFGIDRTGLDRLENLAVEGDALQSRPETRAVWLEGTAAGRAEFRCSYTVWGAVRPVDRGAGMDWRALSDYRRAPVRRVLLRVRLPRVPAPDEVDVHANSGCRRSELSLEADTIVYRGEDLPAHAFVALQARFPEGWVRPPVLLRRELKVRYGTALLFALPGGCFLSLLVIYLLRGRDPRVTGSGVATDPLPPALAGLVLDEHAGAPEASAAIVDLLRRGVLATDGTSLTLRRTDGLAPYERTAVEAIFGRGAGTGSAVAVEAPHPKEAPDGTAVGDAVYAEGVARGFFRRSPARERAAFRVAAGAVVATGVLFALLTIGNQRFYLTGLSMLGVPVLAMSLAFQFERSRLTLVLLGGGAVLLAVAAAILAPALGEPGVTWHAKLAVGITLCGPILFGFAPVMPAKTIAGAEAMARAAACRRALESAPPESFEEWLGHAVAFRMKKPFCLRAAAAGARTPAWWTPAGAPLEDHVDALIRFLGALSARFGRDTLLQGGG